MRRGGVILLLGLLLGTAGFSGFYYLGMAPARQMMQQPEPELAWLKKEFNIGDAEFARIVQMHEAYLPQCAARCRVIEEQNQRLRELMSRESGMTPEIQVLLLERAKTRAQCEAEMLKHFQEVSRAMPAEQGRRYLVWVQEQTILHAQTMESRHQKEGSQEAPEQHHHH